MEKVVLNNFLSNKNIDIYGKNDIKIEGQVIGEENIKVELENNFINEGLILANKKLNIKIDKDLINNESGEISSYGDMKLDIGGDIKNNNKLMTESDLNILANNLYIINFCFFIRRT